MDISSIAKHLTDDPDIINEDFEVAMTAVKLVKGKVDNYRRKNPHKIPKDQMLFVIATMWNNLVSLDSNQTEFRFSEDPEKAEAERSYALDLLGNTFGFNPKEIEKKASRLNSEIQNSQAARQEEEEEPLLSKYARLMGMNPKLRSGQGKGELSDAERVAMAAQNPWPGQGKTSIYDISVEKVGLSIRALNCLDKLGVYDLGELCALDSIDILSTIWGSEGTITLKEIEDTLKIYGLELAQSDP